MRASFVSVGQSYPACPPSVAGGSLVNSLKHLFEQSREPARLILFFQTTPGSYFGAMLQSFFLVTSGNEIFFFCINILTGVQIHGSCLLDGDHAASYWLDRAGHINLKPDASTYNSIINALSKRICKQYSPHNPHFDIYHETDVLSSHLTSMTNAHFTPQLSTYTDLLLANSKLPGDTGRNAIASLWQQMTKSNLVPDQICYTVMLTAQAKNDNIEGAVQLFNNMREVHDITPDLYCFTAVLSGLARCKHKTSRDVEDFFNRTIKQYCLIPNIISINILLDSFARDPSRPLTSTLDFFYTKLKAYAVMPNVVTCGSVLDACARHGNREEGRKILDYMTEKGIAANVVTYNNFLKCNNNFSDAFTSYKEIDFKPSIVTISILLDIAIKNPTDLTSNINTIIDEMHKHNLKLTNNLIAMLKKKLPRQTLLTIPELSPKPRQPPSQPFSIPAQKRSVAHKSCFLRKVPWQIESDWEKLNILAHNGLRNGF